MPGPVRRTLTVALLLGTLIVDLAPVTGAAPASSEPGRTVTYPGIGLRVHLGEEGELGQTSPSYLRFVNERLLRLWKLGGGSEKCRPAPTVIVKTCTRRGSVAGRPIASSR